MDAIETNELQALADKIESFLHKATSVYIAQRNYRAARHVLVSASNTAALIREFHRDSTQASPVEQ